MLNQDHLGSSHQQNETPQQKRQERHKSGRTRTVNRGLLGGMKKKFGQRTRSLPVTPGRGGIKRLFVRRADTDSKA